MRRSNMVINWIETIAWIETIVLWIVFVGFFEEIAISGTTSEPPPPYDHFDPSIEEMLGLNEVNYIDYLLKIPPSKLHMMGDPVYIINGELYRTENDLFNMTQLGALDKVKLFELTYRSRGNHLVQKYTKPFTNTGDSIEGKYNIRIIRKSYGSCWWFYPPGPEVRLHLDDFENIDPNIPPPAKNKKDRSEGPWTWGEVIDYIVCFGDGQLNLFRCYKGGKEAPLDPVLNHQPDINKPTPMLSTPFELREDANGIYLLGAEGLLYSFSKNSTQPPFYAYGWEPCGWTMDYYTIDSITDGSGNSINWEYDEGKISKITDSRGREFEFTYYPLGTSYTIYNMPLFIDNYINKIKCIQTGQEVTFTHNIPSIDEDPDHPAICDIELYAYPVLLTSIPVLLTSIIYPLGDDAKHRERKFGYASYENIPTDVWNDIKNKYLDPQHNPQEYFPWIIERVIADVCDNLVSVVNPNEAKPGGSNKASLEIDYCYDPGDPLEYTYLDPYMPYFDKVMCEKIGNYENNDSDLLKRTGGRHLYLYKQNEIQNITDTYIYYIDPDGYTTRTKYEVKDYLYKSKLSLDKIEYLNPPTSLTSIYNNLENALNTSTYQYDALSYIYTVYAACIDSLNPATGNQLRTTVEMNEAFMPAQIIQPNGDVIDYVYDLYKIKAINPYCAILPWTKKEYHRPYFRHDNAIEVSLTPKDHALDPSTYPVKTFRFGFDPIFDQQIKVWLPLSGPQPYMYTYLDYMEAGGTYSFPSGSHIKNIYDLFEIDVSQSLFASSDLNNDGKTQFMGNKIKNVVETDIHKPEWWSLSEDPNTSDIVRLFSYNDAGQLIKQSELLEANRWKDTEYIYWDDIFCGTYGNTNATGYLYQVRFRQDPDANYISDDKYHYDCAGHPVKVETPFGHSTDIIVDQLGLVQSITGPDDFQGNRYYVEYEYDNNKNIINKTEYYWLQDDDLPSCVYPLEPPFSEVYTDMKYDYLDNLVSMSVTSDVDSIGQTTWIGYDKNSKLIFKASPESVNGNSIDNNNVRSWDYEARGLEVLSCDGGSNALFDQGTLKFRASHLYGLLEYLGTNIPSGKAEVERTLYDINMNPRTLIDPNGNIEKRYYDAYHRLQRKEKTGQGATEYEYDLNDNLIKYEEYGRIEPQGPPSILLGVTEILNDMAGRKRIVEEKHFNPETGQNITTDNGLGINPNASKTTYYEYDGTSRLTRLINDNELEIVYEYDSNRR